MVMLSVRWTEPVTLKTCLSGTRESAYNGWIFRRKILSLPRVVFNKKLCEPNGTPHPILRPRSVPYVHQPSRILYLQKSIHYCKYTKTPGTWYCDHNTRRRSVLFIYLFQNFYFIWSYRLRWITSCRPYRRPCLPFLRLRQRKRHPSLRQQRILL